MQQLNFRMDIPARVLLDTNVVNLSLDWRDIIFDGANIPNGLSLTDAEDILALRNIFITGQRAAWQIAISPITYQEITATSNSDRRAALKRCFTEFWLYWREIFNKEHLSDEHADSIARSLLRTELMSAFPQCSDRELICHAIAYGCDAFCTRDRKTILKRRHKLQSMPLRIISLAEWWYSITPYAALWI